MFNVSLVIHGDLLSPVQRAAAALQDFREPLRRIGNEVVLPAYKRDFEAGGRPKWTFVGYESQPPMVKSGMLRSALTMQGAPGNVFAVGRDSAEFGIEERLPDYKGRGMRRYPAFHQFGWRQRTRSGQARGYHQHTVVPEFTSSDLKKMEEILTEYVGDSLVQATIATRGGGG